MASERQVPTFHTRASRWSHAVFMPVAARTVSRHPPNFVPGQRLEPGFGDIPTLSTLHQRFTRVRLTSGYLTGVPAFSTTLTTPAIEPKQLVAVWTLVLQPEPEGPSLISCVARCSKSVLLRHQNLLFAPSWRTVICVVYDLGPEAPGIAQHFPAQNEPAHIPVAEAG